MEKALGTLSKQQLLALLKEQSQVHSKEMASHKEELQKTEEELKRSDEYLRKYVSKSGVLEEKVAYLEGQLAMFRRMQFGQKRERFEDADQLALPFEASEQELQKREEDFTEKIAYQRKKKNTNHKGRQPLPDHLPVYLPDIG